MRQISNIYIDYDSLVRVLDEPMTLLSIHFDYVKTEYIMEMKKILNEPWSYACIYTYIDDFITDVEESFELDELLYIYHELMSKNDIKNELEKIKQNELLEFEQINNEKKNPLFQIGHRTWLNISESIHCELSVENDRLSYILPFEINGLSNQFSIKLSDLMKNYKNENEFTDEVIRQLTKLNKEFKEL